MEQSSNVSLIYFILFESIAHSQETNVSRQKSYTSCERVVMVIGAASNKAWKKKCMAYVNKDWKEKQLLQSSIFNNIFYFTVEY